MDILGSALTSPSVSWSMNRSMSSSHFKRTQETKKVVEELETTGGFDRSERLNQHQNYNTNISVEWEEPVKRSLSGKLKELFRRAKSSSADEAQPLLINRPKNKPIIPREELKTAGKRFRKALHQSIRYMAIGMENMSTMIYISANVPSSVYYGQNSYESSMPYY